MKISFHAMLLTGSVAVLAACATTDPAMMKGAASAAVAPATSGELYVTRVEQVARRAGVKVVWINPPKTR